MFPLYKGNRKASLFFADYENMSVKVSRGFRPSCKYRGVAVLWGFCPTTISYIFRVITVMDHVQPQDTLPERNSSKSKALVIMLEK